MKHGAQVGGKHGRGHALAGYIGHDEVEMSVLAEQIAVIAADHSGGLIVIRDVPSGKGDVVGRQQAFLDLRRQLQIVLQRTRLLGGEAIQTDPRQGILQQPLVLDRAQAYLAHAEAAVVNAVQRAVHFLQQLQHAIAFVLSQHIGQPRAPRQQLLADVIDVNRFTNCHG